MKKKTDFQMMTNMIDLNRNIKNPEKHNTYTKITFFLLFFLLSGVINGYSQNQPLKKDTSGYVKIRTSQQIKKYLENDDFLYDTDLRGSPQNFFQRVWFWILQIIQKIIYGISKGRNLIAYIFYGIMLAALIFIILKLVGLNSYNLFIKSKKLKIPDIPVYEEDIFSVNIDKIISEAVAEKNYRKAVRFLYIKLLKVLTINEKIEWKPEKTNKDYKKEMKKSQYFSAFNKLTKLFEYVWYGEFELNKKQFDDANNLFISFYKNFR